MKDLFKFFYKEYKLKFYILFKKNSYNYFINYDNFLEKFQYYISENWRGKESKEEIFTSLYEDYATIIDKILFLNETPNFNKYLFYYLLGETRLNQSFLYYFLNDKNFKKYYQDLNAIITNSYYNDGYYSKEEFYLILENIKKRFKKDLKEIYTKQYQYALIPRKENKNIKNFYIKKFKEIK